MGSNAKLIKGDWIDLHYLKLKVEVVTKNFIFHNIEN